MLDVETPGDTRLVTEFESTRTDAERTKKVTEKAVEYGRSLPAFQDAALSADPELAMQQDFSRLVMLVGGVMERFLDLLLNEFPYDGVRLEREEREKRFKLAFDEQTVTMHRLLMRRSIEGVSVSLGELTEIVYPQQRTSEFNKKRAEVRDKFLVPMEELWLWDVNPVENTDKNGEKRIARYEISAGPALRLFSRDVFTPLRRELLKQLINRL